MDDCTVTGCQIGIYEKTGTIKFETKIYQRYCFAVSHKTANFMKIVLVVCMLVRYREKYGEKEKIVFASSRYQRKQCQWFII